MAANINGVFTENLQNAILQSKVLIVGAGGIGCEILKNLVMTGFVNIDIVSMLIFIKTCNNFLTYALFPPLLLFIFGQTLKPAFILLQCTILIL